MLGRYRTVLARPRARQLALAVTLANLGFSGLGLAVILTIHARTGAFGGAGLAVGAFAILASVLAPVRGRLVDRLGAGPTLVPLAVGQGACLLGVAATNSTGIAIALCGVAGGLAPPVIASSRPRWRVIAGDDDARTAYSLDAILREVAIVAGPPLAALLATSSPTAALGTVAALVVTAAALVTSIPHTTTATTTPRTRAGAIGAPGVRALVAVSVPVGLAIGAMELALPALAAAGGSAGAAAVPLAALAVVSALAGLYYGARAEASPARVYRNGLLAMAAAFALLPLAGSIWLAIPPVALAGLGAAPCNIAIYELLDRLAPAGADVEALTWITTAEAGGAAGGSALAGAIAGAHLTLALALPAVGAVSAAVLALALGRRLRA
jgi:hypothetical protein